MITFITVSYQNFEIHEQQTALGFDISRCQDFFTMLEYNLGPNAWKLDKLIHPARELSGDFIKGNYKRPAGPVGVAIG